MPKHRVFISYHHANDQDYYSRLSMFGELYDIFTDMSVHIGDIDVALDDQAIRQKIRDEHLRESSVTLLLVGTETYKRKHVDWEVFSSMIDGSINKRSGILVINLPSVTVSSHYVTAAHDNEKSTVHSTIADWITINSREEYERRYPYMPARIVDNLLNDNAKISVVNWSHIESSPESLSLLIDNAYQHREYNKYDLSRPMRRADA